MPDRGLTAAAVAALLTGCAGDPGAGPPQTPQRDAAPAELVFQAVDAGTGGALTDRQMTVRYLVRTPITLDTFAVERVSSSEPYRVRHAVSTDSLVLEVRLEAPSYFRQDTVLSVARGATAGPFTLRMARRLDRVAQSRPATNSGNNQPSTRPAAPAVSLPTSRPAPTAFDRSAISAGDRAYGRGDWAGARDAYLRMGKPTGTTGPDAQAYYTALVRLGVSQMNMGAYGGALEALEEATSLPAAGYDAFLHLGRAQCHVGRVPEGRATLGRVSGLTIPAAERPAALALVEYGRGLCSEGEFDKATSALDKVRTGARAVRELEGFIQQGEPISPKSPELGAALADARTRITDIQRRARGG